MKKTLVGFCTAVACVMVWGSANATSIVQIDGYSNVLGVTQTTPWNPLNPILTFNKFDTTLGTLVGVTVKLTANVDGQVIGTNKTEQTLQIFQYGQNAQITYTGVPDIGAPVVLATSVVTGPFSLAGGASQSFTVPPASNLLNHSVAAADFGGYETAGLGTFGITLDAFGFYTWSAQTGVDATGSITNAGAIVEVDYEFRDAPPQNEVPEPATMVLFGAGLTGLAGMRLRKKK